MITRGVDRTLPRRCGILLLTCLGLLPIGAAAQVVSGEDPSGTPRSCAYSATHPMSQVSEPAIHEASALVASQQWPGIYWTFNDSNNTPTLYALDTDGRLRGTFLVPNASNVDWEAMQLGPDGSGGYALFIGDIGDNRLSRGGGVIYRVPEPTPNLTDGPASSAVTAAASVFRFTYSVAARNVEAMLVHPRTGEIVLISQGQAGFSMVYRFPRPLTEESPITAELSDVLDARELGPYDGRVTDATISSDGRYVVVRTNSRALVYDVPDDMPLARMWRQKPLVFPLDDGRKGEGLSFRLDTRDLITIGEGLFPALYVTEWTCASAGS